MSRVFWFLFVACVAILAAVFARSTQGNVAILFPPYRIDLSINAAFLILLAVFVLAYLLLSLLSAARRLPQEARRYRERKQSEEAVKGLSAAVKALFEGRFARAEGMAAKATEMPAVRGVAALVAARSAASMAENERTVKWLNLARDSGEVDAGHDVVAAERALEHRRPRDAMDAIARLHARGARHVHTLRIKLKAATALADWQEVLHITRQLEKHKALHPTVAAKTKADAYGQIFNRLSSDSYGLTAQWQRVPRDERTLPAVALQGAKAFDAANLGVQARMILEAALAEHWDDRLLRAYAHCSEISAATRIEQAERWLVKRGKDAALLGTLGALCMHEKLWGKARQYLEESLALHPSRQVHAWLAQLAESTGEAESAAEHYKAAALFDDKV
ncbi:MAG: heme biosynthesis HemY N-terminal domain-containing protein [Burkholderiaceae bacterium]